MTLRRERRNVRYDLEHFMITLFPLHLAPDTHNRHVARDNIPKGRSPMLGSKIGRPRLAFEGAGGLTSYFVITSLVLETHPYTVSIRVGVCGSTVRNTPI